MPDTEILFAGAVALGTLILALVAVHNWMLGRAASRPVVEAEAAWLARGRVRVLVTVRNKLSCSLELTQARLARPWLGRLTTLAPTDPQDHRAGRTPLRISKVLAPDRTDGSYTRSADLLEFVVEMPRWRLGDRVTLVLTGREQELKGRVHRWRIVARPEGPEPAGAQAGGA
jgi:hypothetical protein